MAKSYLTLRNLYGTLTNNSSTSNLTLGDQFLNDAIRSINSVRDWPHLYRTATDTTVASQQSYPLPGEAEKLQYVTMTIGTTVYTPREIEDRQMWEALNQSTSQTSSIPEFYFIFNSKVYFYPTPSAASNTITFYYKKAQKDLSITDYTTGTITTATQGSTAIVGSGSTWTVKMAGRYLRITDSDTANTGDGFWYEISAAPTATTITLLREYAGTSIAAGSASYTIGQLPLLPEAYHDLPVYKACENYFTSVEPDANLAALYYKKYEEGLAKMEQEAGSKSSDPLLYLDPDMTPYNPNFYITLS